MAEAVDTLVAVSHKLRLVALSAFLRESGFSVLGQVSSLKDAVERVEAGLTPDLLIAGDNADIDRLTALTRLLPRMRIVILLDRPSPGTVGGLSRVRIHGLLHTDIEPDALLSYIGLVMLGETVTTLSAATAQTLFDGDVHIAGVLKRYSPILTKREFTVIQQIEKGWSNKEIARLVGITEGTVKVHVRSIQRKLRLRNRTQVAVWSVENGLKLQG